EDSAPRGAPARLRAPPPSGAGSGFRPSDHRGGRQEDRQAASPEPARPQGRPVLVLTQTHPRVPARYIAVEGVIGVGKTSLAKLLAERLQARLILEQPEENPFLEDFYTDHRRSAF